MSDVDLRALLPQAGGAPEGEVDLRGLVQGSFGQEFAKSLQSFDFGEGMLGRFSRGLGQKIRDWSNEGKSLEQLQREGAKFAPMPSRGKAPPFTESVKQLVAAAQQNPGATLGEFIKAAGEDFWMFLIPEFGWETKLGDVAAKIAGRSGRVAANVATGAAKWGAMGAGAEAAAQSLEPGEMDLRAVVNQGAMFAAMGAAGGAMRRGPKAPEVAKKPEAPASPTIDAARAAEHGSREDARTNANGDSAAYQTWLSQKAEAKTQAAMDEFRNAEQQAYDLMQRGASKQEVERAIKRSKHLNAALAAIRGRRAQVEEAKSGFYVGGKEADIAGPLEGYKFDPPRGESRAAPKNAPSRQSPPQLPLAAIAAVGLGSAAALYDYSRREGSPDAALASAAGLTLAALAAKPATTPLGALLEHGKYTLKTLDRLPQNKFEFTREQVLQHANRADVTKAEKEIVLGVLGNREKISAKELVMGFKEATGDFELKGKETSEYADYGLEGIGRASKDAYGGYTLPEGSRIEDAVQPRTTIYQSPTELGDANHFGDPNYFAHTRSFDEGGIRHVVEIQSDLAQKAGKGLTESERSTLQANLKDLDRRRLTLEEVHTASNWVGSDFSAKGVAAKLKAFLSSLGDLEIDYKLRIGDDMFRRAESLGAEGFLSRVESRDPGGRSGHMGNYDVVVDQLLDDMLNRSDRPETRSEVYDFLEPALYRELHKMRVMRDELKAKLAQIGRASCRERV